MPKKTRKKSKPKSKSDLKPLWVSPGTHDRVLSCRDALSKLRIDNGMRGRVGVDEIVVQSLDRSKLEKTLKLK
jgi:hypothetical protein